MGDFKSVFTLDIKMQSLELALLAFSSLVLYFLTELPLLQFGMLILNLRIMRERTILQCLNQI